MSSKSKQIKNIYDPTKKKSGKQMSDYLLWLIFEGNQKLDEQLTSMFNMLQKLGKKNFKNSLDDLMLEGDEEDDGGSDVGASDVGGN
jgi:hypothetical protein